MLPAEMDRHPASYFTGITWKARKKLYFIITDSGKFWNSVGEMYAVYWVLLISNDTSTFGI